MALDLAVRQVRLRDVQRLLAISYDDDCPLSYLPLHVSQSHLPDSQLERHACVFCDDFALITEGQNVPPE
ncbi:hypothetical protein ACV34Z_26395, partial [Pseudomonas aeruginosa]